jgi:hypothetical protein
MTHKLITGYVDKAKQHLFNATIDLPQYSDPAYRAMELETAIGWLREVHCRLEAEAAVRKAMRA